MQKKKGLLYKNKPTIPVVIYSWGAKEEKYRKATLELIITRK